MRRLSRSGSEAGDWGVIAPVTVIRGAFSSPDAGPDGHTGKDGALVIQSGFCAEQPMSASHTALQQKDDGKSAGQRGGMQ